ncbi:unnamed protein product [Nippostrongylus brasiliensis]|uniref:GPI transamidase component PIG-T (inferred by orthology to a human protein) n=1 Tax=Nippostrongylus brasiliensis TaxID=27835 RepID=A0A158R341_NIPBR|nr:unnamed protein product [Nippostrongylus brasiliensis]
MRVLLFLLFVGLANGDTYNEQLRITRLPTGKLLTAFHFTVISEDLQLGPEYSLFPRAVSEWISGHSVSEMSFILTQGRWHSSRWGLPPQPSGPTGASVHAWLAGNETTVDSKWRTLITSLNGLLCTSLTSVVPQLSSSPKMSFKRVGVDSKWRTLITSLNGLLCTSLTSVVPQLSSSPKMSFKRVGHDRRSELHLRYGTMGKETVCTENLTPWKKFLPCKQHGLVTLLNPLKLYHSVYHSIGLELHPQSENGVNNWKLQLFVYNVFDVPMKTAQLEWSIYELFSRKIVGTCSAARSSKLLIDMDKGIRLEPSPTEVIDAAVGVFDLKSNLSESGFTVSASYEGSLETVSTAHPGSLSVSSVLGGTDQQSGTLTTVLRNEGEALRVVYTHQIPWFMQVFYHTLVVKCGKVESKADGKEAKIHQRRFTPAVARQRPALIELELDLPSKSICRVEFEFEKAFLRIREYPPDANHGMYVPAAVVTFEQKDSRSGCMPFNVICFVMTTVSLCFGPIHSFSTKMLIPVNSALPSSSLSKKLFRAFLLVLLALAFYAQYKEMSLHEIRRSIGQFFEKMNSV